MFLNSKKYCFSFAVEFKDTCKGCLPQHGTEMFLNSKEYCFSLAFEFKDEGYL